jgi:hypothetical protein
MMVLGEYLERGALVYSVGVKCAMVLSSFDGDLEVDGLALQLTM